MSRKRLLLADDHQVVIEGLRNLLETEFDILAVVGNMRDLMMAEKKNDPDLIVLDLSMATLKSFEALEQLRAMNARARVIVLTVDTDMAYVMRALDLGASGFVSKINVVSELLTAIGEVLAGRIYVSPSIPTDSTQFSVFNKKPGSV